MQVDDEGGFIKFFRSLPNKDDSPTIRVFDRGDWYTAHGPDADFIARNVYKTTAVVRMLGRSDNGLPSVTMTITVFRNFLREALFRLGKRVEIWQSSGRGQWSLAKQASPGNLQGVEDELGAGMGVDGGESAPIILSVKVSAKANEARNVGVCFADASVRELGVSEFLDNDLYSNFESLLIQLGVKECLIMTEGQKKDTELTKLRTIADSCGIAVSERPVADYGTKDIEQDLSKVIEGRQGCWNVTTNGTEAGNGFSSCFDQVSRSHVRSVKLWPVSTLPARPVTIYETRCCGIESAEPYAWTTRRIQNNESLRPTQSLQDTSGQSAFGTMAQAAFDEPAGDREEATARGSLCHGH